MARGRRVLPGMRGTGSKTEAGGKMNLIRIILAAWERRRLRPVMDGPCRVLCKPGVRFKAFHSGVIQIILALDGYLSVFGGVAVITSANDGRHKKGSLHYENRAIDIRTTGGGPGAVGKLTAGQVRDLIAWLEQWLGPDFDVVLEADHLHVEYDPKG